MDVKDHFRQPVSYILTVHLNTFCIMFHFRGNRHALILVYNNIPRVTIDIPNYHIKSFSVYKLKMDLFSAKFNNISIPVK
jgi:hypothetical protein